MHAQPIDAYQYHLRGSHPAVRIGALCLFQVCTAVLVGFVCAGLIQAQQPQAAATAPVKQAAFEREAASLQQPQSVRFGRQAARVGDQADQVIDLEMRLTLTMRRANELMTKNQTSVRTNTHRIVTTMAAEEGRTSAVRVEYPKSTKEVSGSQDANDQIAPGGTTVTSQSPSTSQPVEGKTYLCQREPGENGKLIVTDLAGNRPPDEEYEIVSQQMDMVGRSNPFAEFLAGRTVQVGEKLEVPKQLASQMFNLGDQFGEVTRFALTLKKIETEAGHTCAVFQTSVEAASSDASQMRLQVEGPLVVHVDSCRAAKISLIGPIGMSETRGSYSTAYQVMGAGRLQMSIASKYAEARR
jgi:hypothetical protein